MNTKNLLLVYIKKLNFNNKFFKKVGFENLLMLSFK